MRGREICPVFLYLYIIGWCQKQIYFKKVYISLVPTEKFLISIRKDGTHRLFLYRKNLYIGWCQRQKFFQSLVLAFLTSLVIIKTLLSVFEHKYKVHKKTVKILCNLTKENLQKVLAIDYRFAIIKTVQANDLNSLEQSVRVHHTKKVR